MGSGSSGLIKADRDTTPDVEIIARSSPRAPSRTDPDCPV